MELALIISLYKEYTDDKQYVFYKECGIIIVMKIINDLECISDKFPKKYYGLLQVVLIFVLDDPYKLVDKIGKYVMYDNVSSYCYRKVEEVYNLHQIYYVTGQKSKEYYDKNNRNNNNLSEKYYNNGLTEWNLTYIDGCITGLYQQWYMNGQIKYEGYYINNKQNGLCKQWYMNGKQKCEGLLENNNKVGQWLYWNELGDIIIK
jgi:antitoxin component YwqK of YwqJK toxin-antitoxin module